jgi:cytochrome P450
MSTLSILGLTPAWARGVHRLARQATQVGPYKVPAGVIVFPCLYSILTYSGNWTKALEVRWCQGRGGA